MLGLDIDGDTWEYPFWVLMRERFGELAQIRHVNVPCTAGNPSGSLTEPKPFTPDATVVLHDNSIRIEFAADKLRQ
jgi:hypothetical protein